MVSGMNRLALVALCLLPALGVDPRLPGALPVATFTYACQGSGQSPTVRSRYTSASRPKARPRSSPVEVYEGDVPTRSYERIGSVQVISHDSGGGGSDLTERAKQRAREMGGDALVEVRVDDAAKLQVGNVGTLALVASVVSWK